MAILPDKTAVRGPRGPEVTSLHAPDMTGIFGTGEGAQAVARGVQQFGQGLTSYALDMQKNRDMTDTLYADSERKRRMLELERNITADPNNYSKAPQLFQTAMRKIDDDTGSLIRNPELRNQWRLRLNTDEATYRIYDWSDKIDREEQLTKGESALKNYSEQYADPKLSNRARYQARKDLEGTLTMLRQRGLITDAKVGELIDKYGGSAAKELATSMMEVNPKGVVGIARGSQAYRDWLASKESEGSGDYHAFNALKYAGRYQFGGPRMQALGFYTPGKGEFWSKHHTVRGWSGTLHIPGFDNVKTIEDFLANKDAQEYVMDAHIAQMDQEIAANGLDQYIGSTVRGVPITREGIYAMLHLGGVKSATNALQGKGNASDAFGTTVLQYAAEAADHNFFKDLPPADRATLESKASTEVTMQETQAGIADGSVTRDKLDAIMPSLDYYNQQRLERAWAAKEKQNAELAAAQRYADPNWVPNMADSKDKEALDIGYLGPDGMGHEKMAAKDMDYFSSTVLPIVQNKQELPPRLKGTLEAMVRSSDPSTVVFAYDRMLDLRRAAPVAFDRDMGPDVVSDLVRYENEQSLFSASKPEDVVAAIRSEAGDPAQAEVRKSLTTKGEKDAKFMAPYVAGFFKPGAELGSFGQPYFGSFEMFGGPGMPADATEAKALEEEFTRLYTTAYAKTGNKDLALKMTIPALKARWQVSNVSGKPVLMRLAPEMFNPANLDPSWMQHQARARLFPLLGNDPFVLKADERTDLELQNGNLHTYAVMVPSAATPSKPSTEGYRIIGMKESKE